MKKFARLLAFSVVFASCVFAQAVGSLSGTVSDPSGAAVAGAKVQLYLPGGSAPITSTTSGPAGEFHIPSLRPTFYELRVENTGFNTATLANISVDPARDTNLPALRLELASTAQALEVKEAAQAVQTTNAELTTTVTQAQVDNLPVLDRQVNNLFLTQAGVSEARAP
jgi:hypothetical protein